MQRRLMVMRHAKSSWTSHVPTDHERPLNERGRRDATRVGKRLAKLGWVPDLVVGSDSAMRSLETEVFRPVFLSQLAAACRKVGQTDNALALVAEALATLERNEERHWEAEIHRLKGELVLELKGPSEAETCFRHAIDIARRQSAKSHELRAVMSLSRLLQRRAKKDEARRMLAEIYGWFTEGFETGDLKDAKVLLDVLS